MLGLVYLWKIRILYIFLWEHENLDADMSGERTVCGESFRREPTFPCLICALLLTRMVRSPFGITISNAGGAGDGNGARSSRVLAGFAVDLRGPISWDFCFRWETALCFICFIAADCSIWSMSKFSHPRRQLSPTTPKNCRNSQKIADYTLKDLRASPKFPPVPQMEATPPSPRFE